MQEEISGFVTTPLSAMDAATMVVTRHDSAICQGRIGGMMEFISNYVTLHCKMLHPNLNDILLSH